MYSRSWLPKRLMSPLWRAKFYIEMRSGMPDPIKTQRLERINRIVKRRTKNT
jgi:hypothetical protein